MLQDDLSALTVIVRSKFTFVEIDLQIGVSETVEKFCFLNVTFLAGWSLSLLYSIHIP